MSMNTKLMTMVAALFAAGVAGAGNLVLIGDSTLAPRAHDPVKGSWGESMTNDLAAGWNIVDVSIGGKTVMTIQKKDGKRDSEWDRGLAALGKGDYAIVQFGINDASPKKLVEIPAFKAEFEKFADAIRAKGATPVFCSPVSSGNYGKDGAYANSKSRGVYGQAVAEAAAAKKVDFVDMTALTAKLLGSMEKAAGQALFAGQTVRDGKPSFDMTHPNKRGAAAFGALFVKEVKARKLPVAEVFR